MQDVDSRPGTTVSDHEQRPLGEMKHTYVQVPEGDQPARRVSND